MYTMAVGSNAIRTIISIVSFNNFITVILGRHNVHIFTVVILCKFCFYCGKYFELIPVNFTVMRQHQVRVVNPQQIRQVAV